MGNLTEYFGDPTLAAVDRAIEAAAANEPPRTYLGMSQIGKPCERELWYSIQPSIPRRKIDAASIKRFEDGYYGEDLMAKRLRMVPGVELHTHNEDGSQFGFADFDGKFCGHMDGAIIGIIQAPKTWHVWEHKQVNEEKFKKFQKLKADLGEKKVLEQWDGVYYAQAVLYMEYSDMERHYLTVSTPGGRQFDSVRTDKNPRMAKALREKASRIITAITPPPRINDSPAFYLCKWCQYRDICHAAT